MSDSDNIAKLKDAAFSTKDALMDRWREKESFTDNDTMINSGIMSESIGLTCVMLLLTAFGKEESFWKDGDRETVEKIVNVSVDRIYDFYKADCYNATPLVAAEKTKAFFTKESGYTDSITWVVSALILARFNRRKGLIHNNESSQKKSGEMLADGIKQLINSQSDRGMWGFIATKPDNNMQVTPEGVPIGTGVPESLYFTYAASTTIADIFDYIIGEIAAVDGDKNFNYRDDELLQYLDKALGIDTEQELNDIRDKTAEWLIKTALPELNKLASCDPLTNEDRLKLGIWEQQSGSKIQNYYPADYICLYYTYYVIDMLPMTFSDRRFKNMVKDDREGVLKAFSLNPLEYRYMNESDNLYEDLYKVTIETAIQLSKNKFIEASRTGTSFWDSENGASELELIWNHNDKNLMIDIDAAKSSRNSRKTSDPALIPMSLRSTLDYCFYISNGRDYTIDRTFNTLLNNRSQNNEGDCVMNLWDNLRFNLTVTERAIEALIDYSDYQNKFSKPETTVKYIESGPTAFASPAISDIDANLLRALDAKISDHAPAATPVLQAPATEVSIKSIVDEIYDKVIPREDIADGYEKDTCEYKMLEIFEKMFVQMLLKNYRDSFKENIQYYDSNEAVKRMEANRGRWIELIKRVTEDSESHKKWSQAYDDLMGRQKTGGQK